MHPHFLNVFRRWPALALPVALLFSSIPARAGLWAFVDAQGVTHFAAEQVDARYTLFFKGNDLTRLDLGARPAAPAARAPSQPVPRRFAGLDESRGYKAVQRHIQAAARAHAVDYGLIKAVIAAESGFDPAAISPKGAVGLMQLLPTTAAQYGVAADPPGRPGAGRSVEQKLTDPRTNILAGTRYLAYLLKLFQGDTELAVAAYNAGEGAVQRAGRQVPNYKETRGYVRTVMGLYAAFKPAPAPAGTPPVASIVSRIQGRVRVELGGAPAPAPGPAPEAASPLVPVRYSLPVPE